MTSIILRLSIFYFQEKQKSILRYRYTFWNVYVLLHRRHANLRDHTSCKILQSPGKCCINDVVDTKGDNSGSVIMTGDKTITPSGL